MNSSPIAPNAIDLQLFEAMPGSSALLLPDAPRFTILAVTVDYAKTSGRTKEAFIGKGLFEAFPTPPDDPEETSIKRLRASLEQALLAKEPQCLPLHRYDIPTADGSFKERYWSAINKPLVNERGEVYAIIHHAEDLTATIKAEQTERVLHDLQKRYQGIITAPILMCILKGEDYSIAMANEQILSLWGRTKEVIGRPLLQAMPELAGQGFIEIMDEVKRTGQARRTFETASTFIRGGGVKKTLYLDYIFHPYFDRESDTVATGIVCLAHDVTEQVRNRQRIKNVVEQAPDPILILMGEDLVLDVANQALFDLWQAGPEVLQIPFLDILPEMKDQVFFDLL